MQTAGGDDDAPSPDAEPETAPARKETKAQAAKRKKEEEVTIATFSCRESCSHPQQKAIAKIKASKQFQRRRKQYGSDDDMTDEDEAARAVFEESMAPLPGQMENCEVCEKRFSVTAYSRAGPDGGLLCPKCSKDLDKEEGSAKKKRKLAAGRQRRQLQSNLLDGIYPGAKDLMTLCIETLAKNVQNANSLGDLSDELVDKIAAILSKKRLMTPETLYLFLRPGSDTVTVYDAAKLSSDDFIRIFQIVPTVKHIRLRNAIQFKNKVMDHLLGTTVKLQSLSLHGANLIDDERWNQFLTEKGSHLQALKVYHTDGHFGDEQLDMVAKHCPNLRRLKVCHNQKVTEAGVRHIAKMGNLTHLGLELYKQLNDMEGEMSCLEIIDTIGGGLRTLSLATIHDLSDALLEIIHESCQNLSKLRLTDNSSFTDNGFAKLFTGWLNPPLVYLDLHKCRHIDAAEPRENPNNIGLGSTGFEALMAHSGSTLKHLNVHSCRHISREAFEHVFAENKTYPEMQEIDISFCQSVNDFVVGCIFRSCPNLKTLKVFGNFGVKEARVPKGKILIGVPNALGMQIEGTAEDEGRVI